MAAKIIGRATSLGVSTGNPPNVMDVVLSYMASEFFGGPQQGDIVVRVDMSQTDAQILNDLRTGLAAGINASTDPDPGFIADDIRGCNL
jgi:hypothetical protein